MTINVNLKLIDTLEEHTSEINVLAQKIMKEIIFFEQQDNKVLKSQSNEAIFLHLVSHLYGLFFERSRVNTNYIINKMDYFGGDFLFAEEQLTIINNLRTYYFHYLSNSKRNEAIKNSCLMWFNEKCEVMYPENEDEWSLGVDSLFSDSLKVLVDIKECLVEISKDDDLEYIKEEWIIQKKKDFPDYKLTGIVQAVCQKFSLSLDAHKFIKTHSSKIRSKLSIASFEDLANLNIIVKQWVEDILFDTDSIPCPVSGDDISDRFKVTGKDIGRIKLRAVQLFKSNIYLQKEDLLVLLKEEFKDLC